MNLSYNEIDIKIKKMWRKFFELTLVFIVAFFLVYLLFIYNEKSKNKISFFEPLYETTAILDYDKSKNGDLAFYEYVGRDNKTYIYNSSSQEKKSDSIVLYVSKNNNSKAFMKNNFYDSNFFYEVKNLFILYLIFYFVYFINLYIKKAKAKKDNNYSSSEEIEILENDMAADKINDYININNYIKFISKKFLKEFVIIGSIIFIIYLIIGIRNYMYIQKYNSSSWYETEAILDHYSSNDSSDITKYNLYFTYVGLDGKNYEYVVKGSTKKSEKQKIYVDKKDNSKTLEIRHYKTTYELLNPIAISILVIELLRYVFKIIILFVKKMIKKF